MSTEEFEKLLRKRLKLINCRLRRRQKSKNDYTITTLEKDEFWMYWEFFPDIKLMYRPMGRPFCEEKVFYKQAIDDEITYCINQWLSSMQHSVYDVQPSQRTDSQNCS